MFRSLSVSLETLPLPLSMSVCPLSMSVCFLSLFLTPFDSCHRLPPSYSFAVAISFASQSLSACLTVPSNQPVFPSLSFPLPISSVRHSAMRLRSKYVTSPLHLVLNSLGFGVFVFSDVMRRCVLTVRLSWSPLSVHHWIRVNPRRGLLYNSLAGYYIYDLYYDYNPRVRLLNPSELRTCCITVALAFQL